MRKYMDLVKSTIVLSIGRFATQFMSLLLLPICTHFLSTSDYGTVDLIVTYISLLAPVITLQQEMATFRYLVDARGNKEKIGAVLSSSARGILYGLLGFLVPYLFACLLIDFDYKLLILLNIVFCSIANFLLQSARGLGKNLNYAIASIISGLTTLISNIILICLFGFGAESILISMILANIFCLVYLAISLKIPKHLSLKRVDREITKSMLKYSLPLVPNGISWWVINASDRTIVSLFLGVAANGIYAAANKISAVTSGLISVFSLSWTESVSLHIDDPDRDQFFSSVANRTVKLFSLACAIIIAGLPLVFDFFIGVDYADAYAYIPIFIISSIFNCVVAVYSAIYVAKKLTKKVAATSIAAAVINIVINLIFVHFIGLYAAALSTAIAFCSMAVYRHFDLKKYVKIKYHTVTLASAIGSVLIASAAYYLGNIQLCVATLILISLFTIITNRGDIVALIKTFSGYTHKNSPKS